MDEIHNVFIEDDDEAILAVIDILTERDEGTSREVCRIVCTLLVNL